MQRFRSWSRIHWFSVFFFGLWIHLISDLIDKLVRAVRWCIKKLEVTRSTFFVLYVKIFKYNAI